MCGAFTGPFLLTSTLSELSETREDKKQNQRLRDLYDMSRLPMPDKKWQRALNKTEAEMSVDIMISKINIQQRLWIGFQIKDLEDYFAPITLFEIHHDNRYSQAQLDQADDGTDSPQHFSVIS